MSGDGLHAMPPRVDPLATASMASMRRREAGESHVLILTAHTFTEALIAHSLLFVLFFEEEHAQGSHLLSNFSLAA
eukprot:CAMPEP_0183376754 /NCGR_PEP_ID=MMETSP0164_2-20130417/121177_1 /TAXON_ID=221442 /ORGANISM="Coccolithus pelagicus ssp braarudi, Strain PLY182g" /LENGTH=75 /DNA_ID=CAMNT_0025554115 /DNA_START=171 /DNA_END=394 /DNA_ORIENTATION=+